MSGYFVHLSHPVCAVVLWLLGASMLIATLGKVDTILLKELTLAFEFHYIVLHVIVYAGIHLFVVWSHLQETPLPWNESFLSEAGLGLLFCLMGVVGDTIPSLFTTSSMHVYMVSSLCVALFFSNLLWRSQFDGYAKEVSVGKTAISTLALFFLKFSVFNFTFALWKRATQSGADGSGNSGNMLARSALVHIHSGLDTGLKRSALVHMPVKCTLYDHGNKLQIFPEPELGTEPGKEDSADTNKKRISNLKAHWRRKSMNLSSLAFTEEAHIEVIIIF
jgi:hypothetical protein